MEEPPDIMGQHQKVATLQRNIAVHDKLCHHASKHAHMLRTGESADEDDEEAAGTVLSAMVSTRASAEFSNCCRLHANGAEEDPDVEFEDCRYANREAQ